MVPYPGRGITKDRHETQSVNRLGPARCGETGEFRQCGEKIDRLGKLIGRTARGGHPGRNDKKRNAVRLLVVRMFCPDTEITKVKTVISPQHDDGVVVEIQFIECGDHPNNLRIDVTRARVIPVNEIPLQFIGESRVPTFGDRIVGGDFPSPLSRDFRGAGGQ